MGKLIKRGDRVETRKEGEIYLVVQKVQVFALYLTQTNLVTCAVHASTQDSSNSQSTIIYLCLCSNRPRTKRMMNAQNVLQQKKTKQKKK